MGSTENLRIATRLVPGGDGTAIHDLSRRMDGIDWTSEEYAMIHGALDLCHKGLNYLLTTALWEQNRTLVHVLIRSFSYCNLLTNTGAPSSRVASLLQTYKAKVATLWVQNTSATLLSDDSYIRLSRTLNAHHLIEVLSLDRDSRFLGDKSVSENILAPLIANNDAVQEALPTVVQLFASHSAVTWRQRPRIDEVLDIAAIIAEYPGAGDFIALHAKERNAYDGRVIRDALGNGVLSLSSGVL